MYIPPVFIIAGIMILVGAIAWGVRKIVPLEFLRHHHEVAFPIFLQIGVIYAVLLAFLFSLEWDNFKTAREEVEQEATTLVVLMHLAQKYPTPIRQTIEQQIVEYTEFIIHYDWPRMMNKSTMDRRTGLELDALWNSYLNYSPSTAAETAFFQDSLSNLQKLIEYRQLRLFMTTEQRPPTRIWLVLIGMGGSVVSVSFMFGMRYIWSQTSLIAILAGMITIIITLIILMSAPLSGHFQLPPRAFEDALVKMQMLIGEKPTRQPPGKTLIQSPKPSINKNSN